MDVLPGLTPRSRELFDIQVAFRVLQYVALQGCHYSREGGDMTLSTTPRSTVQRGKKRAVTDRGQLYRILDENLVCHLGVVVDGAPRVLPTGYARDGDVLYLHGSSGARSLRTDSEVCVTVTRLNGIVYARSSFHHSVNYESVVVHGPLRPVEDKVQALGVITEHLAPGSWDYTRKPTKQELAKTTVLALDLTEASVKIRAEGPGDDEDDLDAPIWAGVLPVHSSYGTPQPAPDLVAQYDIPAHILSRR
jgi:hypothetical protein